MTLGHELYGMIAHQSSEINCKKWLYCTGCRGIMYGRLVAFRVVFMLVSKNRSLSTMLLASLWLTLLSPACAQSTRYQLTIPPGGNSATVSQSRSWGALQFIGPDTIADVAASVAAAVVNIDVASADNFIDARSHSRKGDNRSGRLRPPDNDAKGTGSGVIIGSDGLILTSHHLLEGSERIHVTLHDGRSFLARVLGKDVFSDLALLKIDAVNLPIVTFGDASRLRPGDWVLAVGSPLGLDHTVTLGIISAIGREAKSFNTFGARSGAVRFIQTDAAINPGNSGGPLVNLKGEVVGINAFVRGSAQNIGFAIPADIAQDVAEKLTRLHVIPHPFIGIVMVPETNPAQSEPATAAQPGVMVQSVIPKGPAFMAGVLPGDLITAVDNQEVRRPDDVSAVVRRHDIGDHLLVVLKRAGQERILRVQVEQLPEEAPSGGSEL